MKIAEELNEKIIGFKSTVSKEVVAFLDRIEKCENEFEVAQIEKKSTLGALDKKHQEEYGGLLKKCEYLKAEVWRYKHLLEEFSKAKTGPEMAKRIQELEEAINEHTDLKLKIQDQVSKERRSKKDHDFAERLNNIQVKISVLKDQMESRILAIIESYKSYIKNHVFTLKGTTEPELLVAFNHANYSNYTQTMLLGSTRQTIKTALTSSELMHPEVVDFQDSNNLIIFYDDATKEKAESISDNLIFRSLSSNLPDKISLHIYDRQMFEIFSEFLKLPPKVLKKGSSIDVLSTEIENLENAVRDKLALVWSDINSGNQSIHEYNVKKIKEENFDDIIPYHLFVVDNCQSLFTRNTSTDLLQRMNSLKRYGTNFVLLFKLGANDSQETKEFIDSIPLEMFSVIDFTGLKFPGVFSSPEFETSNLSNEHKKQILDTFLAELNEVEKNRSIIKFIQHCERDKSKWFAKSAAAKVNVAVGKSLKNDGFEAISFTTKSDLAHILMVGGIGSGKTNFLKTIITSIALEYDPNQVELYLIDMKSGAGFSVFEEEKLPHAKLYVFSAENELIKDVFDNLKQEMDWRYREFGDNLEDVYKDPILAQNAPKRKIVIIDEFASIFTDDDMYHDEIAANILVLATKGRAMGINLFFATQNFNSVRVSAFNQAMTDFATRVVLKGSPESSASILDMSNNGYKEVNRQGEGFVNSRHGQVNSEGGNRFFKSFLLDNEDLVPLLKDIRINAEERGLYKSDAILIDGARPARFDSNKEMFIQLDNKDAEAYYRKNGVLAYLGEAFLMRDPNHLGFNWKITGKASVQNVLITGNEREVTIQALFSLISSLTYGVPDGKFALKLINPFDAEYTDELGLNQLAESLHDFSFEAFSENELHFALSKLKLLLESRKESNDRTPILIFIPGLENFVKLRKDSNGDIQAEGELFRELLFSGSSYGLYFICEINKPGNFVKMGNYSDYLNNFEHRIVFSLNAEESMNLIDSKMASKLISEDNQSIRNKGLYYNHSNQTIAKFKSYNQIFDEPNFIRRMDTPFRDAYKLGDIEGQVAEKNLEDKGKEDMFNDFDINQIPDDVVVFLNEDGSVNNDN